MSDHHANQQSGISPPYGAEIFEDRGLFWYADNSGNLLWYDAGAGTWVPANQSGDSPGAGSPRGPSHQSSHGSPFGRLLVDRPGNNDTVLNSSSVGIACSITGSDRVGRGEEAQVQTYIRNGFASGQGTRSAGASPDVVALPNGGHGTARGSATSSSVVVNSGSWDSITEGNTPLETNNSPSRGRPAENSRPDRTQVIVQPFIRQQTLSGVTTRTSSEGEHSMRVVDEQFPYRQHSQRGAQSFFGQYPTTLNLSFTESMADDEE